MKLIDYFFKAEESVITKEQAKDSEQNKRVTTSPTPAGGEENIVNQEAIQLSGFSISDRCCNALIAVIVVIISFLAYRRLFLM